MRAPRGWLARIAAFINEGCEVHNRFGVTDAVPAARRYADPECVV
jgi:hypothetical protein